MKETETETETKKDLEAIEKVAKMLTISPKGVMSYIYPNRSCHARTIEEAKNAIKAAKNDSDEKFFATKKFEELASKELSSFTSLEEVKKMANEYPEILLRYSSCNETLKEVFHRIVKTSVSVKDIREIACLVPEFSLVYMSSIERLKELLIAECKEICPNKEIIKEIKSSLDSFNLKLLVLDNELASFKRAYEKAETIEEFASIAKKAPECSVFKNLAFENWDGLCMKEVEIAETVEDVSDIQNYSPCNSRSEKAANTKWDTLSLANIKACNSLEELREEFLNTRLFSMAETICVRRMLELCGWEEHR